ncbi:TPA: ATP-binding cassette domain-containing protein, partial [Clostridioides difficile]|nr:ATP-binding cassette domain-containing protein [Clostridioides difficile]
MLEISGIYKAYRRQEILKGVTLTVKPGECVGIVGYNGCGKTTLLSILAGARKAD